MIEFCQVLEKFKEPNNISVKKEFIFASLLLHLSPYDAASIVNVKNISVLSKGLHY